MNEAFCTCGAGLSWPKHMGPISQRWWDIWLADHCGSGHSPCDSITWDILRQGYSTASAMRWGEAWATV